jgi:hypothetical protein
MNNRTKISILNRLGRVSSTIIAPWEKKKVKQFSENREEKQPVFIIGAPRTGSTILYQMLTNKFNVLYIDNLVDQFHRNFYFGFCLSEKAFKHSAHNCFKSKHGNTLECGLRAPSESGGFWYRWLPKEHHYISKGSLPDRAVNEMRGNIFSVMNKFDKPLLFKNLNAGQRLGLISEIAPNAKFIYVKRDPMYTAQSIYKAKQKVGIQPDQWWSVKPKNYKDLLKLNPHEQIVKQIFFLEKQIEEDAKLFPKENFKTVQYLDFCNNTDQFIKNVGPFLGKDIRERQDAKRAEIRLNEKQSLPDEDFAKFEKEISKLDWCNYDYEQ